MIRKLLFSFIFAFLFGWFIDPLSAQSIYVNSQSIEFFGVEQQPPPPLGPACGSAGLPGGLQIDPEDPTCCVNGYVYLNGTPARDAIITITAPNGVQEIVSTPISKSSYRLAVALDDMDLAVGDTINIAVQSYTVIEQEGESHEYKTEDGSPIVTFNKTISDLAENIIYDIHNLNLGNLDIHTNETVTIITEYTVKNGDEERTLQDTTTAQIPDPSYSMMLNDEPLGVRPGQTVTMTVTLGNAETEKVFTARPGSIQVDVVMPNTHVNSSWVNNYISARTDHAVAYDVKQGQLVLFGGRDATGNVLNDTWVRTSTEDAQWIQQPLKISPSPRTGHTLLYHDRYETVLLFGGQDAARNSLNDLWVWNGTQWRELFLSHPPSPRSHHSMVYDPKHREVILFGGQNDSGVLSDTWALISGSGLGQALWSKRNSQQSPPKRYNHTLAYGNVTTENGIEKVVILFGGRPDIEATELLNDTWLWDGSDWEQGTSGPLARENHSLISTADRKVLYLFGGNNKDLESLNDLWRWRDSTWEQIATTEPEWPSSRSGHAAVYDPSQEQVLIIGGKQSNQTTDYISDSWKFSSATSAWQVESPPDFIGWQGSAMARELNRQYLIFGGLSETVQDNTYRWRTDGWETVSPPNRPPARYHHTLTSGKAPEILLFGGINDAENHLNDTWLWNGQDWIQQNPPQSPPPRAHYAIAYDQTRSQWWLFGGLDQAGNSLNDLWSYDGTTWEQHTSSSIPSARMGATLVYDTAQKTVLLFGGLDNGEYIEDLLWAWDGTTWERQTASAMPAARAHHGATYDDQEKRMIIAGGEGNNGPLTDTWAWDGTTWHKHAAKPKLSFNMLSSLHYHPPSEQAPQLIGMGTQSENMSLGNMLLTHEMVDQPIATISYLEPQDLSQHEVIYLSGQGTPNDDNSTIVAHQWMYNDRVISREATFTMIAADLAPGTQLIRYSVQDNEGNWSEEQIEDIFIHASNQVSRIYLPTIMR